MFWHYEVSNVGVTHNSRNDQLVAPYPNQIIECT